MNEQGGCTRRFVLVLGCVVSLLGREGPTWRGRWQRENSLEETLLQWPMRRPPTELISCCEPDGRMRRTSHSDITKFPFSLGVFSRSFRNDYFISFFFPFFFTLTFFLLSLPLLFFFMHVWVGLFVVC